MNTPHISRRGFCGGALAASSLVAAGIPLRALAAESRRAAGTPANVQVSRDGQAVHMEPCLAVNPRDPGNLLAACELSLLMGAYASFDGGQTWQSTGPLPLPAGALGGGNMSAAFDATGRCLVCGLVLQTGTTRALPRGVWVWRTDDGGRTFTPPVAVSGWGPGNDRPWLAIEPQQPGTAHVVWAQGPRNIGSDNAIGYARSTDGGQTFTAPRTIARAPSGLGDPMVACGPSGSVYVIYGVGNGVGSAGPMQTARTPSQTPMTATVVCSYDGGQTFGPPITLGHGTINILFPGQNPNNYVDSMPAIAADPRTGLICAVFSVHKAGASHADVMLTASRDGGRTWSAATAVTPQDQLIYFQPQVAIDNAGRIGVMAYTMSPGGLISVVLMLAKPCSLRFGPPVTVTNAPFNPAKGGLGSEWRLGNYQALATTPGAFHPLWTEAHTEKMELFTAAVPASTPAIRTSPGSS
jgi:BNR repeat-like domain